LEKIIDEDIYHLNELEYHKQLHSKIKINKSDLRILK